MLLPVPLPVQYQYQYQYQYLYDTKYQYQYTSIRTSDQQEISFQGILRQDGQQAQLLLWPPQDQGVQVKMVVMTMVMMRRVMTRMMMRMVMMMTTGSKRHAAQCQHVHSVCLVGHLQLFHFPKTLPW